MSAPCSSPLTDVARKGLVLRLEYAPASVPVKMLLTSPVRASPSVLSSTPAHCSREP
ncbi:hypothetical protein BGY98DRAFT_1008403 [Russula aff. rugulosa BPL654]|nr:hypothetical protein BGY98DRAFT_1008403 [Russula aff. rugulosa BPL654]